MLSIIVTHYKSPALLKLCLSYLKKHSPEGSEIIVSDSETIEPTRIMMYGEFPEVTFLEAASNLGFAKLVNRGLVVARGGFLLIMNADITVTSQESIPLLVNYMVQNEDVGVIGPRLLNIDGSHQSSCFRFYAPATIFARRTFLGETRWGKRELARFLITEEIDSLTRGWKDAAPSAFPVDWLMGSALLVRREAYEAVGPLDERYFMYFEDLDWCRSFWEKGWRVVYFPGVAFYHYHGQASKKRGALVDFLTNKYTRIHLASALKYFRKYGLSIPRYGV